MRLVVDHRTQGQGVEGVHLLGMARAFERAGAEVSIVSPPGVEVGRPGAAPRKAPGLRGLWWMLAEHVPETLFELMEMVYNVPAYFRLRRALRTPRADALYERYAFFHVAGALAAGAAGVPLILEVNYTAATPLYRNRSRLLRPLARAAERFVFRRAGLIVAVSSVLREAIVAGGIPADRVLTMPNAADPDRFRPEISGEAVRERYGLRGARVVGFTGAFFPWHGVGFLLDALAALLRDMPEAAALLVGDGPERPLLEERVRREGLEARVRFAGWIGHEGLPEHVAAFDIAVMPDSNEYGSPMKIYEYMAMGKPVVAPRLGPLADGIVDGGTGILFPRRDPAALQAALASLLGDEALRARMGANARAHVLAHHTWDRNAARVLERIAAAPEADAAISGDRGRTVAPPGT
ncbi:MAG TPA: glycosyltransferase family 4 protein [Candidatus Omnitrophota bacterium]|nr:glycosyltransferase family 4 protein [Candidatus Omnitrophota bacterium]